MASLHSVFAQGTAFMYQGRLVSGGAPANGSYDLTFTLYATNSGGVAGAGPVTNSATGVTNGLFAVTVDFGGVFTGSNYWLELAARTNGSGAFSTLAPRQAILPVPYAVYAPTAGAALTAASAGSVAAADISGPIPLGQLPAAVITNNETGVNFNGAFNGTVNGNAAGLTNNITFNSSLLATNPVLNFNGTAQQYSISNCYFWPSFAGNNGTISIRCHNVVNFTTASLHWLTASNIFPIYGTLTFTAFGTNDINAACVTNLFNQ